MVIPKFSFFEFNNRITFLISTFGIIASVFAVSFTNSFYVYVLVFGVSIGFRNVAPINNCLSHIPNKKGIITDLLRTWYWSLYHGIWYWRFIL